jgi:hypothetical protein
MEKDCMEIEYKKLWAAVLKQAIKDAKQDLKSTLTSPGLWFYSNNDEVGSFLWICRVLNIDPDLIRPYARVEMKRAA